jgi:hypothetical protein
MDDWHYLQDQCKTNPMVDIQLASGRPVAALVLSVTSPLVKALGLISIERLFSIICISAAQAALYLHLEKILSDKTSAFFLCLSVFLTPGIGIFHMWATASPFSLGVLFAIIAGILLSNLLFFSNRKKNNFCVVITAFLVSLFAYPPTAFFIFVPVGFSLILKNEIPKNFLFIVAVFYLPSLLFYFLILKGIYPAFHPLNSPDYNFDVQLNVSDKLNYLLFALLPSIFKIFATKFWWINLFPYLFAIVFSLFNLKSEDNILVKRSILFFIMLFLLTLPHLVLQSANVTSPRVFAASQALICLVLATSFLKHAGEKNLKLPTSNLTFAKKFALPIFIMIQALFLSKSLYSAAFNPFIEITLIKKYLDRNLEDTNLIVVKNPVGSSYFDSTENNGFNWTNLDYVAPMTSTMIQHALKRNTMYYEVAGSNMKGKYKREVGLVVVKSKEEVDIVASCCDKKKKLLIINLNPISNKQNNFNLELLNAFSKHQKL